MLAILLSLLAGIGVIGAAGGGGSKAIGSPSLPTDADSGPMGHDDDGHTGGHDDDGHTGGHGGGMVDLPTTPAEIDAFVAMVRSGTEPHVHDADSTKLPEHMALLDLVAPSEATHIAIGHGSWFDPENWHNGEIPGDDAKVVIPDGVEMLYDDMSDARLFTVRVDGELSFATDIDSKMVVDTFVVSPKGSLVIGTEETPVQADVDVDIVIANNGDIDTDWDPNLLSRGVISHGKVEIHGAMKDSHEKVIENPMAGDTSIEFADAPMGWEVGDKIIIAGTNYKVFAWDGEKHSFTPPEDEIRYISKIEGNEVFFDDPLVNDHDTPRDDLFTSVANYTRNVSISTENGDDAEIHERGHAMFMHSDDVDVRYAEFSELGRTDKSESAFDASDFDDIMSDSNVKGRYGLHLHRLGTDDQENPAMVIGNVVDGSPGWGFVHHDSHAILENNASYNTWGAGFVSESGNETGEWNDNIAIFAIGRDGQAPKVAMTGSELAEFDTGKSGDGFWFQSRLIDAEDNVAASVNNGFVYFHRGPVADDGQLVFDSNTFRFGEALHFDDNVRPDDAPIINFKGNEAFAAKQGLHVVKANPNQQHDIHSVIDDFTAWNVKGGVHLEYTAHYVLKDLDVIAIEPEQFYNPSIGVSFGRNATDITLVDSRIEGFREGVSLLKDFSSNSNADADEEHEFVLINNTFVGNGQDLIHYDPTEDVVLTSFTSGEITPSLDLEPLEFSLGPSSGESFLEINGTKTDNISTEDFPAGLDDFKLDYSDMVKVLEENGYYTASDGNTYTTLNLYFSDRLNGDVYKQTELVKIDPDELRIGSQFHPFKDAKDNGEIEISDLQTMASGDAVKVTGDGRTAQAAPQSTEEAGHQDAHMTQHAEATSESDEILDALTKNQPVLAEEDIEEDSPAEAFGAAQLDPS